MVTIWSPVSKTSHHKVGHHVISIFQSFGNYVVTIWQSCDHYMTTMGHQKVAIQASYGHHVVTMWSPCGRHVIIIYIYINKYILFFENNTPRYSQFRMWILPFGHPWNRDYTLYPAGGQKYCPCCVTNRYRKYHVCYLEPTPSFTPPLVSTNYN